MGNQRQAISVLLGIVAAAVVAATASADIINVPGDQPTIQAGIDAAVDGDEVVVADGVWTGAGNKDLDFGGKLITVRSANGPDSCTIDCEQSGRGFVFQSGEVPAARVLGFTIRNGLADSGGAIMCTNGSSPRVERCVFESNSAGRGGGMANFATSSPKVINCVFRFNTATGSGGGGGMYNVLSSPFVFGCLFAENEVIGPQNERGGGMRNETNSNPYIINCTFVLNVCPPGSAGGMHNNNSSVPTVCNCIFWGNENEEILPLDTPIVNYSCVQGGWSGAGGVGNIAINPLWVDPLNGDYRLSPSSPCIDAGSNNCVQPLITTDLDGNCRFVDEPFTPDTGFGKPPIVDMGAYEFQEGLGCCPSDLNGDGVVDFTDLTLLLTSWVAGTTQGDIGGPGGCGVPDGVTDFFDLSCLLAAWAAGGCV